MRYLKEHSRIGFVFGDLQHIDAQGKRLGLVTYQDFDLVEIVKNAGWISQAGNLFRRTVLGRVGLLYVSLHFRMDRDSWLRAALVCQFGYLPRPLARFRRHEGAKTTRSMDVAAHDTLAVYRKFFGRADLPAELVEIRQRAWAGAHLHAATAWYAANNLPNARVQLWAALRRDAGIVLRTPFRRVLLRTLLAGFLGGRDSRVFQFARAVWRKASAGHNLSMRAQT